MPTYDFRCKDCGAVLEDFFPIAERPPSIECPKCGGEAERSFSAPAVYFAGNPEGSDPWNLPSVDKPFEGTGFEGAEGPNPLTYESTKAMFEMGESK